MTLVVHASKGAEKIDAPRSSPVLAVAFARALFKDGWTVYIVNDKGEEYEPSEFDHLLAFDPPPRTPKSLSEKPVIQKPAVPEVAKKDDVFDTLHDVLRQYRARE
jgi:hypothetical protein